MNVNNNMKCDENSIDYNKFGDKEILIRELLTKFRIKLNNELYEFIDSEEKKKKRELMYIIILQLIKKKKSNTIR